MMASHVVWLQLSHAACAVRAVSAASTCTLVCVRRTGSQAQQQSNKRTNDQRAAGGKGRSYGRHGSSHGSRQDRGGGGRGRRTNALFSPPSAWYAFNRKRSMNIEKFSEDVPWSSVYQAPRPYDPFIIPLPLRMGRPGPGQVPPTAVGNPELLKIPNFFHLTPPAIEKHCAALKPLCTPWPERLPELPLRITTRNYVFPSTSIRHSGARVVKLTLTLSDLKLSDRARRKMIMLAGHRYNSTTDQLTLVGKKCPTRSQNKEYILYLLKVLYIEANKVESWEESEDTTPSSIT